MGLGSQATREGLPLAPMKQDAQLNVYNLALMRQQPPEHFGFLRFDPNNNCNVHCVYCHNHRSQDRVALEDLRAFLDENVIGIDNFQIGCIMEPTLDDRMCDLMLLVARSPVRPAQELVLQTNGILLHRHDPEKLREAGLTRLSVSIDSANPATHKVLRGGTSLPKVLSNLAGFAKNLPACAIDFITTVTRVNVAEMESLVEFGLGVGVQRFVLREMYYLPESNVVDHSRMQSLILERGEFARMRDRLLGRFADRAAFLFADTPDLERSANDMAHDSLRENSIVHFFRS